MNKTTLYHLSPSGGQKYQWSIWTEGSEIIKEVGQVGGKLTQHRRTAEPKNLGKTNETTASQQAILEACADLKHKLEHKYVDSLDKLGERKIGVMLAPNGKWNDTLNPKKSMKKYATYPGHIQPKLDGARCLAYWENDRVVLMTRGKKEWQAPHIKEQLATILPKDAMFDGEIYFHGVPRQTIQKWLSNNYPESAKLEFHVYDIPICDGEENKIWKDRYSDLEILIPKDLPNVKRVLTYTVHSVDEVNEWNNTFLQNNYEGSMFRNFKGLYQPDIRSKDLLKIKLFEDEEFKIADYTQGEGGHSGCVIWICETSEGKQFRVVPNGTLEDRQELFLNAKQHIGKLLTVKFQGFSLEGIPQIAKGIAFRLPEDNS